MSPQKDKPARIKKDFRLPVDLVAWAESFAGRKNKSLTQLVIDCLTELRERNEA